MGIEPHPAHRFHGGTLRRHRVVLPQPSCPSLFFHLSLQCSCSLQVTVAGATSG